MRSLSSVVARLGSATTAGRAAWRAGAVAVVLLAAAAGGLAWTGSDASRPSDDAAASTATPAPVPSVTTTAAPGVATVPGVSGDGITDPAAVVAHHDQTLGGQYTVWADLYWRPANATSGWNQRDIDIAVGERRYTLDAAVEPANDTDRRRVLSMYANTSGRYVAAYSADGTARYWTLVGNPPYPPRVPDPGALRGQRLADLLATPTTRVAGTTTVNGEQYYRVVASGPPATAVPNPVGGPGAPRHVRSYTAVVLFDQEGRLAGLETNYTLVNRSTALDVRFQLTYDRRGATTVSRPEWVDRAAANATEPGTLDAMGRHRPL